MQEQLAQQQTEIPNNELLNSLKTQITDIRKITDRELKRARLLGPGHSGVLFDFKQELPSLIQTIQMMYPHKEVNIKTVFKTPLDNYFEREDMLELLGNLLDNAYKWANTQIIISTVLTEEWLISIEDDGLGCEQAHLKQLSQRGTRLDESTQGDGFGLAIASDIVEAYSGTILFSHSDTLGGFKVTIKAPNGLQLAD